MSTKTLRKRIALVAVSALGFGLLSAAPSSAADEQPSAGTITVAASTNLGASATSGSFLSRTSFSSGVLGGAVTIGATKGMYLYLATAQGAAGSIISAANGGLTACSGTDADSTDAGTASLGVCTLAAPSGTFASYTATYGDLAAGTYVLIGDVNGTVDANNVSFGTLKVVDAGTPVTISWTNPTVTEISATAVDYTPTYTVKDANGVTTVLVNAEHVGYDVTPQTGVAASQVIVTDADTTSTDATPVFATLVYSVNLDGAPAGATGSTISGTQYSITAQLQDSTSAIGAPVVAKYTRLANTSTLTGSVVFTSDTTGTALSALTLSPSVASSNFYVKAVDANGGLIKGATVALTASAGTVDAASRNTDGTGYTAAWTTTQSVAGSATLTAKIVTGATSISSTLTATTTAFGATAGTAASWSVKNNNGSGVKAGTAPAWTAAPNVTSFAVTISGLDASKAAKLTVGGTANTSAPKVNGVTGSIYPVADANGVINVTVTAAGTNSQTVTLAVDAQNDGADSTLTITYATAAGEITTSPAASSLNMATPSSTNAISASVADQYGNSITGGSVTITNTSVPAGVTAATTTTVLTGAGNTATVNAVVGATLGSYVFSIQAKDANGSNVGTASTVTYQVTTTGIAGSLTLADSDTSTGTLTSDNKSTRAVVVAPAALTNALAANTDNTVDITVTTATPAALAFSATATNGIRLFTTDPKNAVIAAGKSTVTGTAGTTHIYAVPTLVGAGTITVTSGGLTQVFTLTGALAAAPKAQLVTLTAGTNANGKAAYTVKTTDIFGNAVAADVNIAISGNGYLSNGFKNMTVTTLATDGTNSFDVISDGSSATGITATVVAGSFQAITAAEATAQSLASASVQSATGSVTVVQPVVPVKSAEVLAAEAATAAVAALEAKLAAEKAAAEAAAATAKAESDAKIAAAEAAAKKAGEDAVAAANAASAAAVEAAQAATDAATEALDAANAATDAANASAEAGDAATAAAQDAADAVAALSTQVSEMISALKKQITALTNLVIKIQKKVKA